MNVEDLMWECIDCKELYDTPLQIEKCGKCGSTIGFQLVLKDTDDDGINKS